jgi:spore maturation protein SpmA
MLNWIWLGLVGMAVLLGAVSGQLAEVTAAAFDACKTAVITLALPLAGIMALWLGIMRLAEKSGLVGVLARALQPIMRWLFPDVPPQHPAMGSMVMNMAANMLGLANAATPLGLRAMQDLEKLNPRPGVATNAMCTFLAVNTSSIQLIPATTVGILSAAGAANPTSIIGTAFLATVCSTIAGVTAVKGLEKLPYFSLPVAEREIDRSSLGEEAPTEPELLAPLGLGWKIVLGVVLCLFGVLFVTMSFSPHLFEGMANFVRSFLQIAKPFAFPEEWAGKHWLARSVEVISLLAIPLILTLFPAYAAARGIAVYEEFVEGAKEGFQVAVRIIPFLVAILVAVGMFRAAGGVDLLSRMLSPILQPLRFPSELLPLVLMRPLSGSGSNGLFAELVKAHGPDSLIARMGGTVMGSTETTFYVIAVYFGSVAIRKTRHAVAAGLIADLVGVIASVVICNFVFR